MQKWDRECSDPARQLYVERQRLTVDNKPLDDTKTIESLGEHPTVVIKDLGAQISWRTVYMVEYASAYSPPDVYPLNPLQLGPMIIHPLLYFYPQFFYRRHLPHSQVQTCVCASQNKAQGTC